MRDRKDGIYLVLAWLAERLPDGSQARREIAERSPLAQIRQASAGERLNTDNLTGEAARTYRDIIGVVGYAEPFLANDESVVIATTSPTLRSTRASGVTPPNSIPRSSSAWRQRAFRTEALTGCCVINRRRRPSSGSRARRSIARPSSSRTASSYVLRSGGLMDP